ncbi:MAG: glycosyltransferase family 2 protein [Planctomycetota bacterium]
MRLAVVIPVYNELELLPRAIERLDATPPPTSPDGSALERSLIVIDDGSTDGTTELVERLAARDDVTAVMHAPNHGKGHALRLGLRRAREDGFDLAIVQDADLEYDPADHARVLMPILDARADAVIGTRFAGEVHRVLYYWHSVANRGITTLSNMLSNLNLTDIECGTKAFGRTVLERLELREKRFGVEPEIIARLAKMRLPEGDGSRHCRIYEVPVSYAGRTYAEGKKIGWRDGVEAVRVILQRNLFG